LVKETRQNFGRVLQVGVQHGNHITANVLQSRPQCDLMTKIASQPNTFPAGVAQIACGNEFPSAIAGTVIDKNYLVIGAPAFRRRVEPIKQQRQDVFFIETGNDDRHFCGRR